MNQILTHLLTGKDNQTHDIARWAWMLGFILIGGAAIYMIYAGKDLSLTELAGALGIVSGSGAASVAGKQLSGAEPDVPPSN
jgi:CHASE2 domain-containing sensor protein